MRLLCVHGSEVPFPQMAINPSNQSLSRTSDMWRSGRVASQSLADLHMIGVGSRAASDYDAGDL
jgi:hypothetical protein